MQIKQLKKDLKALGEAGKSLDASFYNLLDGEFSHALKTGPVFRGIRSTVERNGFFLASVKLTEDAAWSFEIPGEFVFNPVLADMAVQVACALTMKKHNVMAIPHEIGRLHVAAKTTDLNAVVVCKPMELGVDRTVVDLAVREPDGRLILCMDNLKLRTIAKGKG